MHLFSDGLARQADETHDDRVEDELLKAVQLGRREGGDAVCAHAGSGREGGRTRARRGREGEVERLCKKTGQCEERRTPVRWPREMRNACLTKARWQEDENALLQPTSYR